MRLWARVRASVSVQDTKCLGARCPDTDHTALKRKKDKKKENSIAGRETAKLRPATAAVPGLCPGGVAFPRLGTGETLRRRGFARAPGLGGATHSRSS